MKLATPSTRPETGREETALVERMLAGDEDAMETFADGYFPGLYRFALKRLDGRSELARDLVQTTVCKVLDKLETWRGEAPLFSWLCACCRNEIAMHFRREASRPRLVEMNDPEDDPAPSPDQVPLGAPDRELADKELTHHVHLALDHLPPDYAHALEWKYMERLSVKDIATRLDRTPKATESLLTRARNAFQESYEALTASLGGSHDER